MRDIDKFDEKEIVKRIMERKMNDEDTLRLLIKTQSDSLENDYPEFLSVVARLFDKINGDIIELYKCKKRYEDNRFRCCYLNHEGYCRKIKDCEWKENANE